MVNFAELDLKIATYNNEVAQRNLPAWHGTAQRAIIPGTLATKVKAMMARVVRTVATPAPRPARHTRNLGRRLGRRRSTHWLWVGWGVGACRLRPRRTSRNLASPSTAQGSRATPPAK